MTRTAALPRAAGRTWPTSVTLWLLTFAVMSAFQFWRGAPVDGVIFAAITLGLVIERALRMRRTDAITPTPASAAPPRTARSALIVGIALAAGLALVLGPRTGPLSIVLVTGLGVAAIAVAWRREPATPTRSTRTLGRSRAIWAALGLALCSWEAAAYVLSVTVPRGWVGFPTVSLLLEPVVDGAPSRAVLIAVWLALGVWLVAGSPTRRRMLRTGRSDRGALGS